MNSNLEAGRELDEAVGVALGFEPKIIWGASGDGGKSYYATTSDDGPWWHKHQIEEWIKEHPVCCGETLKLESYKSWPRFSTSIADAWLVVEKWIDPNSPLGNANGKNRVFIEAAGPDDYRVEFMVEIECDYSHSDAKTLPHAICLAAISAVQP